jgi:hypothetical protein
MRLRGGGRRVIDVSRKKELIRMRAEGRDCSDTPC